MPFDDNMLPGQEPYTYDERKRLTARLEQAIVAEELFGLDELEAFAEAQRRGEDTDA